MRCTRGKDATLKRSSSVLFASTGCQATGFCLKVCQPISYAATLVQAVLFESQLLSSTCDGEMPLRRHRVWPFVAIAFLFRMQLNFVGPPSPQRHAPARIARQLWPRKSEGPESHQDINSMDVGSVSRWLTTMDLKKYVSKFEDASVDGKLLANLTDEDLQEIGVDHGVHRKKILMRRDDLVGQGLAPSAVLDQWRSDRPGEGDGTKPDLERRQFATGISNYMKKAGLTLGVAQAKIVEEVDNIEHNLLEQSIFLDALQSMNEWAWSQTVDQPGEECVREEVQKDLIEIQLAKAGLKQRMVVTSVNSKQLAVAIISYCESVKSSKASNSEKDFALVQLNESVQTWKNKMVEQVEKASFCHQGLVQRASARIMGSKLPGGLAAQSNLDEFKRLIEEKERAAQKCKQIRKLADPDVELALKARMRGGLKEELEVETWLRFSPFCRQDCLDLCCSCVCFDLDVSSPHHCVGFLFCALHLPRPRPRPPALPPLITSHSSQHNSSHHLSQPPRHTALITAPLITSHSSHHNSSQLHFSHLTHHTTPSGGAHCTTYHISLTTPQLITAPLLTPHSSQRAFWRSCCAQISTQSRTQSRAAWQSCYAHRRCWAAAGCRATGAVHRAAWRSCCARGRRCRGWLPCGRRSHRAV